MREQRTRRSELVAGDIAGDFVLVTPNCAMSSDLKLSVRLGHLDLEADGTQEVNVHYDPLLDGDRLLMPESESRYYIKPANEPDVPRMIPFFSEQQERIYSFLLPSAFRREQADLLRSSIQERGCHPVRPTFFKEVGQRHSGCSLPNSATYCGGDRLADRLAGGTLSDGLTGTHRSKDRLRLPPTNNRGNRTLL